MAEYWKSAPRYWCKHCKTYIRDTAFERNQHEATGRHQGNLKRFLRDIHRNNERDERENQRAKSEVERLSKLVSGGDKSTADSQRKKGTAAPAPEPTATAADRKSQMAQLAEMGVAIPEEFRPEMALAGEWQTIRETPVGNQDNVEGAGLNVGVRKRKYEGQEEEEEAGEVVAKRGWGTATRAYPGAKGDQDDEDLDALLGMTTELRGKKAKKDTSNAKKEVKTEPDESLVKKEDPSPTGLESVPPEGESPTVKKEEDASLPAIKKEGSQEAAAEVPATAATDAGEPAVVFKKRKPKAKR